jgi:hypothetical protein
MTNKEEGAGEFLPRDFVYTGRRLLKGGKMGAELRVIVAGELGERMLFECRLLKGRAVGGIYRGATFSAEQCRDLSKATYQGMWADEPARIDWRVRDEAAEAEQRSDKLEADAKRAHEIEELLLPLRKLYASYSQRHDYGGKEALEAAVLRALRRRPTKDA